MISTEALNFFFENFSPKDIQIPSTNQLNSDPLLHQGEIHLKLNESLFLLRKNESHSLDNIRLNWFVDFLGKAISVNPIKNLNCEFIINISDGCSDGDFSKFCFSQRRGYRNILIPDPHNIATFFKVKDINKFDTSFNEKKDDGIFIGSATGQPAKENFNLRELSAIYNSQSKNCNIKIIPVAGYAEKEMLEKKLKSKNLNIDVFSEYVSMQDQLKHKVIFNIDGHTTSWERPLWIMASNSICINIKPYNVFESWYSNLFDFYQAAPEIDLHVIDLFFNNINLNDSYWSNLKQKQKVLANSVSNLNNQLIYLNNVIKHYNEQFNLKNK